MDVDFISSAKSNCDLVLVQPPAAKIALDDSFCKKSEGDGSVEVCVLLKTDIKRSIEFELAVNNLTAQGQMESSNICSRERLYFQPLRWQ